MDRKLSAFSRLNMEVIDFKYARLNDWWNAQNICSPFTRVYMVTAGTGYLRYRDVEITMVPGNIYVIPAGLRFSYACENGFSKVYFHLSVPLPNGYDLFESIGDCLCFAEEETVRRVASATDSDAVRDMLYIKSVLSALVYRCAENTDLQASGTFSDSVAKAVEFIDGNLSASLTAEGIAEALFLSVDRLRKIFRAETGVPIGQYIRNRLMNRAELEVRRGEFSVKEISDRLGFCDQFYFSRCFSGKYGISPTKYRRKVNPRQ